MTKDEYMREKEVNALESIASSLKKLVEICLDNAVENRKEE